MSLNYFRFIMPFEVKELEQVEVLRFKIANHNKIIMNEKECALCMVWIIKRKCVLSSECQSVLNVAHSNSDNNFSFYERHSYIPIVVRRHNQRLMIPFHADACITYYFHTEGWRWLSSSLKRHSLKFSRFFIW